MASYCNGPIASILRVSCQGVAIDSLRITNSCVTSYMGANPGHSCKILFPSKPVHLKVHLQASTEFQRVEVEETKLRGAHLVTGIETNQ